MLRWTTLDTGTDDVTQSWLMGYQICPEQHVYPADVQQGVQEES